MKTMNIALALLGLMVLAACQQQMSTGAPASEPVTTIPSTTDTGGGTPTVAPTDNSPSAIPADNGVTALPVDNTGVMNGTEITQTIENTTGIPDVNTRDVQYYEGTTGYLAESSVPGTYPGIVMIHEWWGLNDNIKTMARQLAGQGYVVLAVDLYNGVATDNATEAMSLATTVTGNEADAVANLQGAVTYLKQLSDVDPNRIGSLGWCFGGGQSLQLAISGLALNATVIYYGQLTNDTTKLQMIQWPVLGIFGEADMNIPVASARMFASQLNDLGIANEVDIYPGVGHAFANPTGPNYAPMETKDAWQKTLTFLDKNLKQGMTQPAGTMDNPKVFPLQANQFKFWMDGVENPDLNVNLGDTVRIELTSVDMTHNWVVDEFNAMTPKIGAGESTFVEFIADKKGTFEYYCSIDGHRGMGMKGRLIVS